MVPSTLIAEIDYLTQSNLTKFSEGIELLRQIIDEHEKAGIQQIEEMGSKDKKKIEEYEKHLQNEQHIFHVQNALFQTLECTDNNTKLLQLKQKFSEYTKKTIQDLSALHPPIITDLRLEGFDRLETLKKSIHKYGRYVQVPRSKRTHVRKHIFLNSRRAKLSVHHQKLIGQDMKLVIDALRCNLVRPTGSQQCWHEEFPFLRRLLVHYVSMNAK